MSGEFRWVNGGAYFHDVLARIAHEEGGGQHDVSLALTELYRALAPIERGCAWYEASDSGPEYPTIELMRHIGPVREAVARLDKLAREAEQFVAAAYRLKGPA